MANWSGACEMKNLLIKVTSFSQYIYLCFGRTGGDTECEFSPSNASRILTSCKVKVNVVDEWQDLGKSRTAGMSGFINNTPDLTRTPTTHVKERHRKEYKTKRLQSEEGRINCRRKMQELYAIRDHVYKTRDEKFQWDLSRCVEGNPTSVVQMDEILAGIERDNMALEAIDPTKLGNNEASNSSSQYEYDSGSFVAISPAESSISMPYWIGKVLKVNRCKRGVVTTLTVHWLEPYGENTWMTCK